MSTRRLFLKLSGAAATALGLAKTGIVHYAEPLGVLPEHGEWVEDRGDFYIVRVPDFKVFARETLAKPTIFLLGARATVSQVCVKGFSNIQASKMGQVLECEFDASKVRVGRRRPVVELANSSVVLSGCYVQGGEHTSCGVLFGAGTYVAEATYGGE